MGRKSEFDNAVNQLQDELREKIKNDKSSEGETSEIKTSTDNQSQLSPREVSEVKELCGKFIAYTYNEFADGLNYEGFRLSEDEKAINSVLMTYIILYYLPRIDLGKWSLYIFIAFNIIMIGMKTGKYVAYTKKLKKEKSEKSTEDKSDKELKNKKVITKDNDIE